MATKGISMLTRREFLAAGSIISTTRSLTAAALNVAAPANKQESALGTLRSPSHQTWWLEDGLVMAGVDWESLLVRLRGGQPTFPENHLNYNDQLTVWHQEHSRAIAAKLKNMGFNFVMIPLHKGGGMNAERETLEAARQFTQVCHDLDLRVGCYTCSGTMLFEAMLSEHPEAKEWLVKDHDGKYVTYGPFYFRRWINRAHPGYQEFIRKLIRFAVIDVGVDLLHFDNYIMGPGYEPYSVQHFREYLCRKYAPIERMHRFGFSDLSYIEPPLPHTDDRYNNDPIYQDFIDYRCETLAVSYRDLAEYTHSLNPNVIVECNPGGYTGDVRPSLGLGSVDHARLIRWGHAFWDEGRPSNVNDGVMRSHFRSQILGRRLKNMVFNYTGERVAIAEALANNFQCLGCPVYVLGDQVMASTAIYDRSQTQVDPGVLKSIQFFHSSKQYYRDVNPLADVAVLNTFPNIAYGPSKCRNSWSAFTQALYQGKIPFTLLSDESTTDWSHFRVLVLADLVMVSDKLLDSLRSYVNGGGGLVMTGEAASCDEHGNRRRSPGLMDFFSPSPHEENALHAQPGKGRAAFVPHVIVPDNFEIGMLPENRSALLEAVSWAAGGPLQVVVDAPETVTMSLYSQSDKRRILHLVNYDKQHPVSDVSVVLTLPAHVSVESVTVLSPDFDRSQTLITKQSGQAAQFTVPSLEIYDVVVIDLKS